MNIKKWIKDNKLMAGLLVLLVIGGVYFYMNTTKVEPLNKPGDLLVINLYDAQGNQITDRSLGLMSVVGGVPGVAFISFTATVNNNGSVPLNSMTLSSMQPSAMASAFGTPATITLTTGNQYSWTSALINVTQFEGQTVNFSLRVVGSYMSGEGASIPITKYGQKIVTISQDICSDGTPWNQCSPTDKPKYCLAGALVNRAGTCGCPSGYEPSGDNCVVPTCIDGTIINTCTSQRPQYCNSAKTIVNNCAVCGCPNDYYGNPKVCQGDQSCLAQTYKADFIVTLGY